MTKSTKNFRSFQILYKIKCINLKHENTDCRRRTLPAGDYATGTGTGALCGRDGYELCRGRCQTGGLYLRLHSARHHAARRQRAAAARTSEAATQARKRDYHLGPRLARRQDSGARHGGRRLPAQALPHGRTAGPHQECAAAGQERRRNGAVPGQRIARAREFAGTGGRSRAAAAEKGVRHLVLLHATPQPPGRQVGPG